MRERVGDGDWAFGSVVQGGASPGRRTLTGPLCAPIQAKREGDSALTLSRSLEAPPEPTGGGEALPAPLRGKMERALGDDFANVRVHQGPEALGIGAIAYASGDALSFAPGHYDPVSQAGQELIGHELTHVVQQREGRVAAGSTKLAGGIADDSALEQEADQRGGAAAREPDLDPAPVRPVQRRASGRGPVQRATLETDKHPSTPRIVKVTFGKRPAAKVENKDAGSGAQGDHASGFFLFEDGVRWTILQKTIREALSGMSQLTNQMVTLAGYAQASGALQNTVRDLVGRFDDAAVSGQSDLTLFEILQTGIDDYLALRNQIPGTAYSQGSVDRRGTTESKTKNKSKSKSKKRKRTDEYGLISEINPKSGQREKDAKENFGVLSLMAAGGGLRFKDTEVLIHSVDHALDFIARRKTPPTVEDLKKVAIQHTLTVLHSYPDLATRAWDIAAGVARLLAERFGASKGSSSDKKDGADSKTSGAGIGTVEELQSELTVAAVWALPPDLPEPGIDLSDDEFEPPPKLAKIGGSASNGSASNGSASNGSASRKAGSQSDEDPSDVD